MPVRRPEAVIGATAIPLYLYGVAKRCMFNLLRGVNTYGW